MTEIIKKVSNIESSNTSHAITFTFALVPFEMVRIYLSHSYGLKSTATVLQQGWLWN